jgi:hypothetical protein
LKRVDFRTYLNIGTQTVPVVVPAFAGMTKQSSDLGDDLADDPADSVLRWVISMFD